MFSLSFQVWNPHKCKSESADCPFIGAYIIWPLVWGGLMCSSSSHIWRYGRPMNATDYLVVCCMKRLELLILPTGGSFQRISFETTQNWTRGLYHDFPFRTFNKFQIFFSSAILCMVSICTLVFSWTQRCFCCQRITSRVKKGSAFQNVVEKLPWLNFSNCKNCVARRKLNIKENSSRLSYITPLS